MRSGYLQKASTRETEPRDSPNPETTMLLIWAALACLLMMTQPHICLQVIAARLRTLQSFFIGSRSHHLVDRLILMKIAVQSIIRIILQHREPMYE